MQLSQFWIFIGLKALVLKSYGEGDHENDQKTKDPSSRGLVLTASDIGYRVV